MTLPSNEQLLAISEVCVNIINRKYNTVALGAVGKNLFNLKLVMGVNSSTFDDTKLLSDRLIPSKIRFSEIVKSFDIELTKEPYHAETSIILYSKENALQIFGLASTRKICTLCDSLIKRNLYLFDDDCIPVDGWKLSGKQLTEKERGNINDLSWLDTLKAEALRLP